MKKVNRIVKHIQVTGCYILAGIIITVAGCRPGVNKTTEGSDKVASDTGRAIISFSEYEHDFGKVDTGEKIGYIFTYTNSGTGPLVINAVSTSCGCTVPKYDKKPMSPGEKSSLEVVFNTAGYEGIQSKTITVQSNASTPVVILKITAEIINNSN